LPISRRTNVRNIPFLEVTRESARNKRLEY